MMDTYGFGDVRLDERGSWMLERIVATGSLVLRRIGGDRAGEIAAGRFLAAPGVSAKTIIDTHAERTRRAAQGRRVVVAQDTTEINFSGRDRGRTGLGRAADGKSLGFFLHGLVAVDADADILLGVVDAAIWTRGRGRPPRRQTQPVENKETRRWIDGLHAARERLEGAAQIVVVADRESDFYPLLARVPEGVDLVVRCRHDRKLATGGEISGASASWPRLGAADVRVAPRGPGDKGRTARVTIKAGPITIRKPVGKVRTNDPAQLTLGLVEVEEVNAPPGVTPLLWRLLTTLPAATLAEAEEVVRLYRQRWRIEQVFRALKSDGLALEDTQVEAADRLFKLGALGFVGAARILQLVDARDGSPRPATDVLDPALIAPAAAIGATLEGKTARQKNPHAAGSLAWLSWIAARLGGWNCYYKPPGPKTMARGWQKLAAMIAGITIVQLATGPPRCVNPVARRV